jgi:transaldolase
MSSLKRLQDYGQSPWLDYIERSLVAGGGLRRMIEEDGIRGVTSNPSIFENAIAHSDDYRDDIRACRSGLPARDVYEHLAIADVRAAADELLKVYDSTWRRDGYVSLEVSPHLAHDTEGTIAEARRLWHTVARPNLMIKVPATPQGIPAVETLLAEGINVNVTLLFSLSAFRATAEAHAAALNRRLAAGADLSHVASVASFFVSRIDTNVDSRLERLAAATPAARASLEALRGKAAIANAKLAYQTFRELVGGRRWQRLAAAGAMPQRLLWASTSTKNPAYRDVMYVEELIGPDTVNTLPTATIEAFREHGVARPTLEADLDGAAAVMRRLAEAGIAFDEVTDELLDEGVGAFARSFEALLDAISKTRAAAQSNASDTERFGASVRSRRV